MTKIGIRELRENASEYVRRARRGELIEIMDRGTPVALLGPLPVRSAESALDALDAQGRLAQRGQGSFADLPLPTEIAAAPTIPVSEALHAMRDDERN
jgi:prevent-host-death family protein